jgi:hypothetical protein
MSDGAASTLAPPPRSTTDLIVEALTAEPQTSEMVHQVMLERAAGAYAVPSLNTVQSALSTRGDKMGQRVKQGKRTHWVRYAEGETAASVAEGKVGKKKKSARPTKPSKRKAEEASKAKASSKRGGGKSDKLPDVGAIKRRNEELLDRPMSAFMLFGFSQRGALKKQKTTQSVREVVKAVGERWLLLSEVERAKYEAMAREEVRYCAGRAKREAAAREAAAREAAAAAANAEAEAEAEDEDEAEQDDGNEQGDGAEDEEGAMELAEEEGA